MTRKMRESIDYIVTNVNTLSDNEYQQFMDDLICNLEVNFNEEKDEQRDF